MLAHRIVRGCLDDKVRSQSNERVAIRHERHAECVRERLRTRGFVSSQNSRNPRRAERTPLGMVEDQLGDDAAANDADLHGRDCATRAATQ